MSERPLRSVAEVMLGRQRSPEHDSGPHMVPYLRAANVKDGTLDLDDVKEMNFTPDEQVRYQLRPGDVLVSEGSGSLRSVGANAVWSGEIPGTICFQNTLLRIRPYPGLSSRYLAYWARFAFADGMFAAVASGANIFHLGADRVRSLPIRVPSPAEQDAVCDLLDRELAGIDAVEAQLQRVRSLLEERWLTVRREEISQLDAQPVPLRRLATCLDGRRVPLSKAERSERPGDVPYYGPGGCFDWVGSALFNEPLVLLGEDGAPFFDPRRDVAFPIDGPAWVNNHVHVLRPNSDLDRGFLVHVLNDVDFSAFISGSTRDKLTQDDMSRIPVPLPALEQQRSTSDRLDSCRAELLSAIGSLDRQLSLLAERRQVLITEAVTGKLDVSGVAA